MNNPVTRRRRTLRNGTIRIIGGVRTYIPAFVPPVSSSRGRARYASPYDTIPDASRRVRRRLNPTTVANLTTATNSQSGPYAFDDADNFSPSNLTTPQIPEATWTDTQDGPYDSLFNGVDPYDPVSMAGDPFQNEDRVFSDLDDFTIGDISIFFEDDAEDDAEDVYMHERQEPLLETLPLNGNLFIDLDYSNSVFYRNYGVHLYSSNCYNSKVQLFLLKDFELQNGVVTVIKNKFVVLSLLNVMCEDNRRRLVSTCSRCSPKSVFPYYYIQLDQVNTNLSSDDLYSCHHVHAAVSQVRCKLNFGLSHSDKHYGEKLYEFLSLKLTEPNVNLLPGAWYNEDEIRHTSSKGKLSIYFSDRFELVCTTRRLTKANRYFFYCYDCPRSTGCKHTRIIPHNELHDLGDLPDLNGNVPFNIDLIDADLNTRDQGADYNIISNLPYPFVITQDVELVQVLKERQEMGTHSWLANLPHSELSPSINQCCGQICQRIPAPTRAKRTTLFSLNGKYYINKGLFLTLL